MSTLSGLLVGGSQATGRDKGNWSSSCLGGAGREVEERVYPLGLHLRDFAVAQPENILWSTLYKHGSRWFPLKFNTEEGNPVKERS